MVKRAMLLLALPQASFLTQICTQVYALIMVCPHLRHFACPLSLLMHAAVVHEQKLAYNYFAWLWPSLVGTCTVPPALCR